MSLIRLIDAERYFRLAKSFTRVCDSTQRSHILIKVKCMYECAVEGIYNIIIGITVNRDSFLYFKLV